jgi:hypothetical protein
LRLAKLNDEIPKSQMVSDDNQAIWIELGNKNELKEKRQYTYLVNGAFDSGESLRKDSFFVISVIDISHEENLNAIFGIVRTLFVLIIFSILLGRFRNDSAILITKPINLMKRLIGYIKRDPIHANQIIDYYILMDTLFSEK